MNFLIKRKNILTFHVIFMFVLFFVVFPAFSQEQTSGGTDHLESVQYFNSLKEGLDNDIASQSTNTNNQASVRKNKLKVFESAVKEEKELQTKFSSFQKKLKSERKKKLKEDKKRRKREADTIYRQAVNLYRNKKYFIAKSKFEYLNLIYPKYKSTRKYLLKIDKQIEADMKLGFSMIPDDSMESFADESTVAQEMGETSEDSQPKNNLNQNFQESFILDIKKFVEKSKKKIIETNQKIQQQAKKSKNKQQEKRVQKSPLKIEGIINDFESRNYNRENKKTKRQDNGKLKREEALVIEPMQVLKSERSTDVQSLYRKAVDYYSKRKYVKAKNYFEKVDQMGFDYKATRSYLTLINNELNLQQRGKKAKEVQRKEPEVMISEEFFEENSFNEEAEDIFQQALNLYKQKNYSKAQKKFRIVNELVPKYKNTEKYLKVVNKKISKLQARKRRQEKVEESRQKRIKAKKALTEFVDRDEGSSSQSQEAIDPRVKLDKKEAESRDRDSFQDEGVEKEKKFIEKSVEERQKRRLTATVKKYKQALSFYNKKNFIESKRKFIEVEALNPGFKDTLEYLESIDTDISEAKLKGFRRKNKVISKELWAPKVFESTLKKREEVIFQEEAEDIFQQAFNFYKQKNYQKAKEKFQAVDLLVPGYKDVNKYLKIINKKISKQEARERKQRKFEEHERKIAERKRQKEEKRNKNAEARRIKIAEARMQKQKKWKESREQKEKNREQKRLAKQRKDSRHPRGEDFLTDAKLVKKKMSARDRRKVERIYKKALKHYKNNKLIQSKKRFLIVEKMIPQHKSTQRYLGKINWMMDKRKTNALLEGEALKDAYHRKFVLGEGDLIDERSEEEKKLIDKSFEEHKKKILSATSKKYKQAIFFYNKKNFVEAKRKFVEVEALNSGFKDTSDYLERIDVDIAEAKSRRLRQERTVKPKKLWGYEPFELNLKKKEGSVLYENAEDLFQQAVNFYKKKEYNDAKEKFQEVNLLIPGYENVDKYLKITNKKISKQKAKEREKRKVEEHRKKIIEFKRQKEEKRKKDQEARREKIAEERRQKEDARKKQIAERRRLKEEKNRKKMEKHHKKMVEREKIKEKVVKKDGNLKEEVFLKKSVEFDKKEVSRKDRQKADKLYKKALEYYRKRELLASKKSFIEVDKIIPDYKSTQRYISTVNRQMSKRKIKDSLNSEKLKEDYADNLALRKRDNSEKKKSKEPKKLIDKYKEQKIEAHYQRKTAKKTLKVMKKSQKKLEKIKKKELRAQRIKNAKFLERQETERNKQVKRIASEKYDQALGYYKNKEYKLARAKFSEVKIFFPNYKLTHQYLKKIDKRFEENTKFFIEKMQYHKTGQPEFSISSITGESIDDEDIKQWLKSKKQKSGSFAGREDINQKQDETSKESYNYDIGRAMNFLQAQSQEKYQKEWRKSKRKKEKFLRKQAKKQENQKKRLKKKLRDQKLKREKMHAQEEEKNKRAKDNHEGLSVETEKNESWNYGKKIVVKAAAQEEDTYKTNKFMDFCRSLLPGKGQSDGEKARKRDEKFSNKKKRKKEILEKKLEKRLKKQEQARERRAVKEQAAEIKEEKNKVVILQNDALRFYKEKDAEMFTVMAEKFNKALENNLFDEKYRELMKDIFNTKKIKIEGEHFKKKIRREQKVLLAEQKLLQRQRRAEARRKQEMKRLEKRIKDEERRIAREKEIEEKRLAKERGVMERDEKREKQQWDLEYSEIVRQADFYRDNVEKRSERKESGALKRSKRETVFSLDPKTKKKINSRKKMLDEKMHDREKVFNTHRKKIDHEFYSALNELYARAVNLYEEKSYVDASRMFSKINDMSPSFKKTEDYLKNAQNKIMSSTMKHYDASSALPSKQPSYELPAVIVYPK